MSDSIISLRHRRDTILSVAMQIDEIDTLCCSNDSISTIDLIIRLRKCKNALVSLFHDSNIAKGSDNKDCRSFDTEAVSTDKLCELLSISSRTINRWRCAHKIEAWESNRQWFYPLIPIQKLIWEGKLLGRGIYRDKALQKIQSYMDEITTYLKNNPQLQPIY